MKIALVHDYLREYGGAERVLEALHELYPEAPVYVGFVDQQALGRHWQNFADWEIRETWLAKLPLIKRLYSPYRVLAAKAFRSLDLSEYEVVISSSNAYMAKAVQVPQGKHLCYCHTPPRALYGYSTMTNWRGRPVVRLVGTLINHLMRVVDFQVAQQVDQFIANSVETQQRIKKFYRRESVVINPPVKVAEGMEKGAADEGYFLYVSRLAFAKHPELAVQSANQLGLRLKVAGAGAMLAELRALAGETVEFLGSVSDDELRRLYQHATALLYPVEDEDFGMVPVEAMGYGVPVIAHRSGGPLETIIDGETGIFFDELTVEGLNDAIHQFLAQEKSAKTRFDRRQIHRHAQQFGQAAFNKKIKAAVAAAQN